MKEMLLALLLLIIGFVLLIKGADFFVDGSSSVAKRLKVRFRDTHWILGRQRSTWCNPLQNTDPDITGDVHR